MKAKLIKYESQVYSPSYGEDSVRFTFQVKKRIINVDIPPDSWLLTAAKDVLISHLKMKINSILAVKVAKETMVNKIPLGEEIDLGETVK